MSVRHRKLTQKRARVTVPEKAVADLAFQATSEGRERAKYLQATYLKIFLLSRSTQLPEIVQQAECLEW